MPYVLVERPTQGVLDISRSGGWRGYVLTMVSAVTWNVLHRVHAENWYRDVANRWPDEPHRIAAIARQVARRTEEVIALQEVSGDQLAALRSAVPDRMLHALRYPRVPRSRRIESALRDRAEYLVVLTTGPSREVVAEPFASDPGKGALVVHTDGAVVIATHVTGNFHRTRQLARLAELATPGRRTILLGDFNADRATVAAALGPAFTVADLPPTALPTHPRTSADPKSQYVDHIAVRHGTIREITVENTHGLSDHNLVRATVE
ncbi:endonuclease/exonuclease/phosphatase family protein [Nocardia terpenica]|uniref:endonuclease/exonuclease/phosphatase family protein n=1 Tax=Nocardia terpenica TaxID=455432 RepID=UPI002B4B701C|nr:endonuclease/exonuclease/phosphatase family protein [Nocardia terpenica]